MNPPKPKKKIGRQSLRFTRNGFVLRESGRLFIAKLGDIAVRWSRPLPSEPSSVTIVEDATGRYFASFVVETEDKPLPELDQEEPTPGSTWVCPPTQYCAAGRSPHRSSSGARRRSSVGPNGTCPAPRRHRTTGARRT